MAEFRSSDAAAGVHLRALRQPAALALATLAGAVCLSLSASAQGSATMASAKTANVAMKAQNGSRQDGAATLTQAGDNIIVKISLKNGTSTPQPAHIHTGMCANLNPVPKYPLSSVVNGKSTSTLKNLKLSSLETGAFAINVHKSASDLKTYVSCGDIPKMNGMMRM